jgi:hypothetical protein
MVPAVARPPVAPITAVPLPAVPAAPVQEPSAFALDSQPDLTVRPQYAPSRNNNFILLVLTLCLAVGGVLYVAYRGGHRLTVTLRPSEDGPTVPEKRFHAEILYGTRAVYSLRDAQGIWKSSAKTKDYYRADLAAQASDPVAPHDPAGMALLLVHVLPGAEDLALATAVGRDHVEQLHRKDYPDVQATVLQDNAGKPLEQDTQLDGSPIHIVKLHVRDTATVERFVVLGMVHRKENLLVVQCECAFDRRAVWEETFDKLLASIRLKGVK